MKIENVQIVATTLGVEDHGIFSCYLHLSGDGWGCGFGGYALDEYKNELKRRVGTAYGMEFIGAILRTLEVETWEKLKGQHCRVETEGVGGRVLRIGHLMKNKWFDPATLKL